MIFYSQGYAINIAQIKALQVAQPAPGSKAAQYFKRSGKPKNSKFRASDVEKQVFDILWAG